MPGCRVGAVAGFGGDFMWIQGVRNDECEQARDCWDTELDKAGGAAGGEWEGFGDGGLREVSCPRGK